MPVSGESVTPFQPISGEVVLPRMTQPASRSRAVTGASSSQGWSGLVVFEPRRVGQPRVRSEEHTSELQSLMRISYAVFCLKKKKKNFITHENTNTRHERDIYLIP